jgi:hypothetical protein
MLWQGPVGSLTWIGYRMVHHFKYLVTVRSRWRYRHTLQFCLASSAASGTPLTNQLAPGTRLYCVLSTSKSRSLTTDDQSAGLSFSHAVVWDPQPIPFSSLEVIFRHLCFLLWGALSDERVGLQFTSCRETTSSLLRFERTAQKSPASTVPVNVVCALLSETSQFARISVFGTAGNFVWKWIRAIGKQRRLNNFGIQPDTSQYYTNHHCCCKIWNSHGGDYEECRFLGCFTVRFLQETTLRRNVSPPSSGWQQRKN